jgi:hypothetical protein
MLINQLLSLNIDGIKDDDTILWKDVGIKDDDTILWKDVRELTLGGLAEFSSSVNNLKELPFDRLPLSAKSIVTGKYINKYYYYNNFLLILLITKKSYY